MRIRFITWNMGDNRKTREEWLLEFGKSWKNLLDPREIPDKAGSEEPTKYDMLVLSVQEDHRNDSKMGQFAEAVSDFITAIEPTTRIQSSVVNGPPDVFKRPFSVKLYVFLINGEATFKTAGICFKKTLGYCSKGTAGISVDTPNGQIVLMGSHFPVSVKEADLGFEKRVAAIRTSLRKVFHRLLNPSAKNVVALWGGDMNFRRAMPVSNVKGAGNVEDQLNVARDQGTFEGFDEAALQFPPTCKLHACSKTHCPDCRTRTDDRLIEECYETSRKPSHCDRILFYVSGEGVDLVPIEYRSWAQGSVRYSDHNLVWADFVLNW